MYCIEALAYTGLGDEAKARARLKLLGPAELKYRQHVLESPWEMGAYWGHRDWLMADILRREAEERLSQQR